MTPCAFRLFLFILAFAPLAFGTVEHWSLMTVEILTAVSLLLLLIGNRGLSPGLLKVPGMLPLGLLAGFMGLQLVPLPAELVRVVSPGSWEAYEPVLALTGADSWIPVSVNQKATLQELLRIGGYALFYILTVQLLQTGDRIGRTLRFLAVLGAAVAFVAILQQFSGGGRIYWFRAAPGGHPGGPWININQYAAFIEALCPIVLALFLYYRPARPELTSWRQRFVALFSSPHSNLHLFLGFCFVLLVFSVFVTLCRGGIVTILASIILFVLLISIKRRRFGGNALWVAICLALLAVTWFGWQPVIAEFDRTFDAGGAIRDARMQLWADTLELIGDFPAAGGGIGTFNDLYPSYKTIPGNLIFDHAHNDYLELLATGGIVGFGLAAWFCAAVLVHGWRTLMVRGDRLSTLVGIGALVSACALLMHSVVDFNLQNGAVGLYFFFVCGLLVAVVNHRYSRFQEESLLPEARPGARPLLAVLGGSFLALACVVQISVLIASYSFLKVKDIYVTRYLAPELVKQIERGLRVAAAFDPLEGRYPFYHGDVSLIGLVPDDAFGYYLEAARDQPMEGVYLQRLGMMLPESRREEADALMEQGYRRALNKGNMAFNWAEWLLMTGQRAAAVKVLGKHFAADPDQVSPMSTLLQIHGFTREELEQMLPPRPDAWIRYGDYLEKAGEIDESLYYRRRALDFIDSEQQLKPGWFLQLINFHRRHRQPDQALQIIRLGVEKIPGYAPFHAWLGDYYRGESITYRAREEYERALVLDPGNQSYRKKLQKLEQNSLGSDLEL